MKEGMDFTEYEQFVKSLILQAAEDKEYHKHILETYEGEA